MNTTNWSWKGKEKKQR